MNRRHRPSIIVCKIDIPLDDYEDIVKRTKPDKQPTP